MNESFAIVIIALTLFVILDLAALRFGADSRHLDDRPSI